LSSAIAIPELVLLTIGAPASRLSGRRTSTCPVASSNPSRLAWLSTVQTTPSAALVDS